MKRFGLLCLFLTGVLLFTGCAREMEQSYTDHIYVCDDNTVDFSLRMMRTLSDDKANLLLSPFSVYCTLAMAANGASGDTQTQFEKLTGRTARSRNQYLQALVSSMNASKELHLASSVWINKKDAGEVKSDYLSTVKEYYDVGAEVLPFDDAAKTRINRWVKDKTNGKIPTIIEDIPSDASVYLINALAFDAKWKHKFEMTHDATFTCFDGTEQTVSMMYCDADYYIEGEFATGFIKPFEGDRYALVVLLPKKAEYATVLPINGRELQKMISQARQKHVPVRVGVPKFTAEWSGELSETLIAMGLSDAFDSKKADFSLMSDESLYINRVLHKTYFDLNEEGVVASAATAVEMTNGAAPGEQKSVICDRPFFYMLYDLQTQTPLFMGAMQNPNE